jgi:SAM-dependent methyltransferase
VRVFSEAFDPPDPVVEIGAWYPPGYEELCNLRPYFKGREYIGCDIRAGLGVDRIEDAQALGFADSSIGTILLFDILEHLPHPEKAISEARRALSDGGLLALSVPFNYRLHGFPSDYWRFTASGIYTLLSEFSEKIVFSVGPQVKPAFIFAVAAKTTSREFKEKSIRFQSMIHGAFKESRIRGHVSVLKERARDFLGHLLGRAHLSVTFFDPSLPSWYLAEEAPVQKKKESRSNTY